ncbi:VOC family protein [Ferrimonas lipolytica]|uniref:VOC family protein n=1 Tax=Ferrimonas lipolytica TaxID=2724191 RepID=A0A6H1UI90_9GAMM|nr:VOC family protein [Ferrimonas lipolytica]QIZ78801.1 VOC family protein [Ferrimonas lipolytica]
MFSHIMIGANDMQQSKRFYDAVFAELGYSAGTMDEKGRCFYITPTGVFALTKPIDGKDATHGNGSTIGFAAASPQQADAWHQAGLTNGGSACEEPPGIRAGGSIGDLYIAYLRDPSGNKICALHR